MFDAERLLGKVVGELVGSSHNSQYKSGSLLGSLTSGAGLMTALGLAVGAFEILQEKQQPPPPLPQTDSTPPPPIPGGQPGNAAAPPPPPSMTTAPTTDTPAATSLSPQDLSLKMIRIMIAATHADGVLDEIEEQAILNKLKELDISAEERMFLLNELHAPRSLDDLTAGITDPAVANVMYSLAAKTITIDTEAERSWLDDLAKRLNISKALQAFLEEQ